MPVSLSGSLAVGPGSGLRLTFLIISFSVAFKRQLKALAACVWRCGQAATVFRGGGHATWVCHTRNREKVMWCFVFTQRLSF